MLFDTKGDGMIPVGVFSACGYIYLVIYIKNWSQDTFFHHDKQKCFQFYCLNREKSGRVFVFCFRNSFLSYMWLFMGWGGHPQKNPKHRPVNNRI